MSKNIKLDKQIIEKAKIAACKIEDKDIRKRAYALNIAATAAAEYLNSQGLNADIKNSLFRTASFMENLELADIYIDGARLDVRVTFDGKNFCVPKIQEKYSASPCAYLVVQLDKSLKNAKILGFVPSKELETLKTEYEYFCYETSILKPITELKDFLSTVELKQDIFSTIEHEKIKELSVAFMDKEISQSEKVYFIKHILACPVCREIFCDMNDFDTIVTQVKNYHELLNDSTLSVFAGNQKEFDEALLANLATVENAQEDLSSLAEVDEEETETVEEQFVETPESEEAEDVSFLQEIAEPQDLAEFLDSEDLLDEAEICDTEEEKSEVEITPVVPIVPVAVSPAVGVEIDLDLDGDLDLLDSEGEETSLLDMDFNANDEEETPKELAEVTAEAADEKVSDEEVSDEEAVEESPKLEEIQDECEQEIDLEVIQEPELIPEGEDELLLDTETEELLETSIEEPLNEETVVELEEPAAEIEENIVVDEIAPIEELGEIEELNEVEHDEDNIESLEMSDLETLDALDETDSLEETGEAEEIREVDESTAEPYAETESESTEQEPVELIYDEEETVEEITNEETVLEEIEIEEPQELSYEEDMIAEIEEEPIMDTDTEPASDPVQQAEEDIQEQEQDSDIQGLLDDDLLALLSDEDSSTEIPETVVSPIQEGSSTQETELIDDGFGNDNEQNYEDENTESGEQETCEDEDNTIGSLFDGEEGSEGEPQDGEQKPFELAEEPVSEKTVNATKKIIVGAAVLLLLAGGGIAAWFVNNAKTNADNAALETGGQDGMFDLQNQAAKTDSDSPAVSQDINRSMANSFSDKPAAITITKISWQVSEKLAQEASVKEYLQSAGKNIQMNLQNDLANAADINFNNSIKVSFEIAPDNTLKGIQVLESSGSDQIDDMVMRSIKNTLKYVKVPQLKNFKSDYFLTLIINF